MSDSHQQIERLIEVGRFSEARQVLQKLIAEAPDDPLAHTQAARIAYLEGELELASSHIADALKADPANVGARFLNYHLQVDQQRYADAERAILELIRERPADADFIAAYARLMLVTAHLEKARSLVAEARRLDPENREARLVAVLVATVLRDHELASDQLAELVREDPECRQSAYTLFYVLIEQGRHAQALALGRELLYAEPGNESLVEALVALRVQTHWLALPTYPLQRWGWGGSAALWICAIVIIALLGRTAPQLVAPFALAYVTFVIYSWVYPSVMQRWVKRRGIR